MTREVVVNHHSECYIHQIWFLHILIDKTSSSLYQIQCFMLVLSWTVTFHKVSKQEVNCPIFFSIVTFGVHWLYIIRSIIDMYWNPYWWYPIILGEYRVSLVRRSLKNFCMSISMSKQADWNIHKIMLL